MVVIYPTRVIPAVPERTVAAQAARTVTDIVVVCDCCGRSPATGCHICRRCGRDVCGSCSSYDPDHLERICPTCFDLRGKYRKLLNILEAKYDNDVKTIENEWKAESLAK